VASEGMAAFLMQDGKDALVGSSVLVVVARETLCALKFIVIFFLSFSSSLGFAEEL